MKFKKKPVIIEAEQWFPGKDVEGICVEVDTGILHYPGGANQPHIHTLEGAHLVHPGDWIMTGVTGEKYPCQNKIFRMTYEEVKE